MQIFRFMKEHVKQKKSKVKYCELEWHWVYLYGHGNNAWHLNVNPFLNYCTLVERKQPHTFTNYPLLESHAFIVSVLKYRQKLGVNLPRCKNITLTVQYPNKQMIVEALRVTIHFELSTPSNTGHYVVCTYAYVNTGETPHSLNQTGWCNAPAIMISNTIKCCLNKHTTLLQQHPSTLILVP